MPIHLTRSVDGPGASHDLSNESRRGGLNPGTGGAFEIRFDGEVLHSRKETHAFPESKQIKQLVRDRIAPGMSLGHDSR